MVQGEGTNASTRDCRCSHKDAQEIYHGGCAIEANDLGLDAGCGLEQLGPRFCVVPTFGDQQQEGKRVCIELIDALRQIEGVAGVHVMGHRNEDALAQIIVESTAGSGSQR